MQADRRSALLGTAMPWTVRTIGCTVLAVALLCPSSLPQAAGRTRPKAVHGKTVWNYDGGIEIVTDGSIPDGPCFRLHGRVTAPEFFVRLKRIDFENAETVFRRGGEEVKEY